MGFLWPAEGDSRAPYWIYTDEGIYRRELERIFEGPTWSYVALECELPQPGDFKRSAVGEKSVLVVRGKDGAVNGFPTAARIAGSSFASRTAGT